MPTLNTTQLVSSLNQSEALEQSTIISALTTLGSAIDNNSSASIAVSAAAALTLATQAASLVATVSGVLAGDDDSQMYSVYNTVNSLSSTWNSYQAQAITASPAGPYAAAAWATFSGTLSSPYWAATSPVVHNSYNIASVSKTSVGQFTIRFNTNFSSSTVFTAVGTTGGQPGFVVVTGYTGTSVNISTYAKDGVTLADFDPINIVVFSYGA